MAIYLLVMAHAQVLLLLYGLVEVHCGTGYKNNLRELIEYKVPPVKGALVENGTITNIAV